MPSEIRSLRSWMYFVFELSQIRFGLVVVLASVLTVGPCACASNPPPLALAGTRDALAGLDEFGALLLGAGLPIEAIPGERVLSPELAGKLRLYFDLLPPLPQQYAPRFVADELLRFVEAKGTPISRWDLSTLVQEYRTLFVLTPQGYLASALTGAPAYCVGAVQVSQTSIGVGGFELGRYYTSAGGANWPLAPAPKLDRN